MAVSSFFRFPPYFYFWFGQKWPSVTVFGVFFTSNAKRSLLDQLRALWEIGRRQILVLPVYPKPEVLF